VQDFRQHLQRLQEEALQDIEMKMAAGLADVRRSMEKDFKFR
jgi:uncharacterized protein YjiS (DUF1127 family)